jgi:hypothetical protein
MTRVLKGAGDGIRTEVRVFLQHYLCAIEEVCMVNPEIERLCVEIYRNHRHAVDLLIDRFGRSDSALVKELHQMLENDNARWHVFNVTSRAIEFVPAQWREWLPPWHASQYKDPQSWITCRFSIDGSRCYLFVIIHAFKDVELRKRVITLLIDPANNLGFSYARKEPWDKYTRVFSKRLESWSEDEDPPISDVLKKARQVLDDIQDRLAAVQQALSPVLAQAH